MTKAAELAKMGEVLTNSQIGGRRNIVINGAMQVAQRGTSFTSQTGDNYFIDRFKLGITSLGTWTTSQSTDSPNGFAYSAKIECTTADASPASSDLLYFYSRFEGQNLQQLKFGTSDAESVSISFYVKCSKTGVFTVNWRNQDAGRSIGSDVTISSADTWEFKTITFAGDTSGAFNNDNGWSANLEFILNGGTNYTSGNTLTSYASHSNTSGTRGGGTTLALGANTGETIQFTGIQLEVGSQATPFEHRSFGEELALCQRYLYYMSAGDTFQRFAAGFMSTATVCEVYPEMPVVMRATPTLVTTGTVGNYAIYVNNALEQCTGLSIERNSGTLLQINATISSNTIARGGVLLANVNNAVFLSFDAEL